MSLSSNPQCMHGHTAPVVSESACPYCDIERLTAELVKANGEGFRLLGECRKMIDIHEYDKAERDRLRAERDTMWDALYAIDQPGADLCTVTYMQRVAREAMRTVSTPGPADETSKSPCKHEWTDVARCLVCGITYDMYEPPENGDDASLRKETP